MPKEIPAAESKASQEASADIYDVKTLSAETKIKYISGIFDLGKDKVKNEERKNNFMDLVRKYKFLSSQKNKKTKELLYGQDTERKIIHDQIMDIIIKMSLSVGLSDDQRKLTEYLANNRDEVELMIGAYLLVNEPVTVKSSEYLKMKEQLSALSNQTGPEEE